MTRDDELEGWDPTRPLTEGGSGAGRPADAARDGPAGEDPAAAAPATSDGSAGEDPAAAAHDDPDVSAGTADGPVLLPHLERLAALADRASGLEEGAARYAAWVEETLRAGGRLFLCGNGGSAATAEHVATEYVVRFERDRRPLPAVALTGGGPLMTAAANDFSYAEVFERQLGALARPGDLVALHSTTGESENLVRAARTAADAGLRTVALVAGGGGRLAEAADLAIVVPTGEAPRAQELHLAVEHAVVDRVEASIVADPPRG